MPTPFARRVQQGLERSGLGLRQLCRAVELDPSFFSKVLSGKRTPPDDDAIRRIAKELALDPVELIVSAGRIPSEWEGVFEDQDLFERLNAVAAGASKKSPQPAAERPRPAPQPAPPTRQIFRPAPSKFSEELL